MHFLPKNANWHVPESRNVPHSLNLLAEENARHSRGFQVRQQWVVSMVTGTMTVWHPIRQPPVTGVPWSCQQTHTNHDALQEQQPIKKKKGCSGTSTTNVMHCCQKGAYKWMSCGCWIRTSITEHHQREFVWWGCSAEWALDVARGWDAGTCSTEAVPPRLAQMTGQHKNTSHTQKNVFHQLLYTLSPCPQQNKTKKEGVFTNISSLLIQPCVNQMLQHLRTGQDSGPKQQRSEVSVKQSIVTNDQPHKACEIWGIYCAYF